MSKEVSCIVPQVLIKQALKHLSKKSNLELYIIISHLHQLNENKFNLLIEFAVYMFHRLHPFSFTNHLIKK